jgi:hypothetical protein
MPPDVGPFRDTPLWILAAVILASLTIAREAGQYFRLWHDRRRGKERGDEAIALSSALGLLALLMAFTFSLALNRFEERRLLVVGEANALGTSWLRIQLLDEPARTQLGDAFRAYAKARVDYSDARTQAAEDAAYREALERQNVLWPALRDATELIRLTPLAASLVTSFNESIDIAGERRAARAAHVPPAVLFALWLFATVCGSLIGYEKGRYRVATTLLFALLTLSLILILDLDRPSTGRIEVSQQPMHDFWDGIAPAQRSSASAP